MQGTLLQINISHGGLPKLAIPHATVTRRGVEGDSWAHPRYHGGPNQALLLVTAESITELQALGYPLFFGALGENLTTQGLDRRQLRSGQRFRINQVIFELTKLRVPCSALDPYGPGIQKELYDRQAKAGDPSSPRWGLGGFYASVLQGGAIAPQDTIVFVDQVV